MALPGNPPRSWDDVKLALDALEKAQPLWCTNATKPNVAEFEGRFIYVRDAGAGLRMQYSDGVTWNSV
jgi:hypothetical protein